MIEVTIKKTEEVKPFPKIMIANKDAGADNGILVLFESANTGVVIKTVTGSSKQIGYYSISFLDACFTDFNDPVTLKNI